MKRCFVEEALVEFIAAGRYYVSDWQITRADGPTCSLEVFDLGILRLAPEIRSGCTFQVNIEESADVMRRHSNLAAAIEAHNA